MKDAPMELNRRWTRARWAVLSALCAYAAPALAATQLLDYEPGPNVRIAIVGGMGAVVLVGWLIAELTVRTLTLRDEHEQRRELVDCTFVAQPEEERRRDHSRAA